MPTPQLQIDPVLKAFYENIWQPVKTGLDENHKPPMINEKGEIIGETNLRIEPETIQELDMGYKANLIRNITPPNDPDSPQMLKIDQTGKIMGLNQIRIDPETENERNFIAEWEKSHGIH